MENLNIGSGLVALSDDLQKVDFRTHFDFESFVSCHDGACIEARTEKQFSENCLQIVFRKNGVEVIREMYFIVFEIDSRPWPRENTYIDHFLIDDQVVYFYDLRDCKRVETNVDLRCWTQEQCLIALFDKHIANDAMLKQVAEKAVLSA